MTSEPRAQFRQTGGLTALLYATRAGCLPCAQALVRAGADVNQPNPDGVTPLINALDNRSFDIAMFLLDKGANPGVWDMTGRTPLYVAVDMHSWRPRGFVGFGGPVAPRPENKATAMDVVNRLLAMGVDTNHELTRMRPNGYGRGRFEEYMLRGGTGPLMVAAMNFDADAVKALLAHGTEVDLANVFQITPLMAAASMSGSARGNFLAPPEADVQSKAIATIDLLIQAGAKVNAKVTDSHSHTAKLTAYVQGRDHEGQTALFAAAESGWDKVVKDLLAHGADAGVHDAGGKTAVDYARKPPPAAPGAPRGGGASEEERAAVVAMLEAAQPKSPAETASRSP
jgi:ankyrin repeat protein